MSEEETGGVGEWIGKGMICSDHTLNFIHLLLLLLFVIVVIVIIIIIITVFVCRI